MRVFEDHVMGWSRAGRSAICRRAEIEVSQSGALAARDGECASSSLQHVAARSFCYMTWPSKVVCCALPTVQ